MALVARKAHVHRVRRLLRQNPVVVLLGARQVGKATLAREVARTFRESSFFDAERRADLALLSEPELAFRSRRGLIVIDEVQLVRRGAAHCSRSRGPTT